MACRTGKVQILKILFIITMLMTSALAGDDKLPDPSLISCLKIKSYIFFYGKVAALNWASSRYDQKQVAEIRKRCSV